jgi:poly [ADP-ribose] polymerase
MLLSSQYAGGHVLTINLQEIASKLISSTALTDEQGNPINPIDSHFCSLGLSKMEPIKKDSMEFQSLVSYARDTHGATHRMSVKIRQAFRVERYSFFFGVLQKYRCSDDVYSATCSDSETHAWNAKGYSLLPDGERLLLWHGSRTTNFAGEHLSRVLLRRNEINRTHNFDRHS